MLAAQRVYTTLCVLPPPTYILLISPIAEEKGEVHTKRSSNNSNSCSNNSVGNSSSGNWFVKTSKNGTAGEGDNIINKIKELNLVLLQNKDIIDSLRQENESFSSQVGAFAWPGKMHKHVHIIISIQIYAQFLRCVKWWTCLH